MVRHTESQFVNEENHRNINDDDFYIPLFSL